MRLRALSANLRLTDWVALGLLIAYVTAFSWMTIRQHDSFGTHALDLAKVDQAIWNTAQGRPFHITLIQDSIVQSHFSPILALYAPLYWLWANIRLLFVVQSICLAGAGFLIYWFFRRDAPRLGLVVYAAYLMHPSLHQVNLAEFRRVTTAVLATSFVLYNLFERRYGWMSLGLVIALMSKENLAFLVVGVGLYMILADRVFKAGLLVTAIGLAWLILIPFVVLPTLESPGLSLSGRGYSLAAKYYSYLGISPGEMFGTLLRTPTVPLQYALRPERLMAVFRLCWPLGFLFLLSPEIASFSLPFLGYLLTSRSETMGQLEASYPSLLLPVLYWAAAIGLSRLEGYWRSGALIGLLGVGTWGCMSLSDVRPARWVDLAQFKVTQHHRQVEAALAQIPDEAVVTAQDPLVPHLSHRQHIYLFPWIPDEVIPEYIVLDRKMKTYPVTRPAYRTLFYNVLAGTEYDIENQIDSLYIFRYAEDVSPEWRCSKRWEDLLTLIGYRIAWAGPDGSFGPVRKELPPGSALRVSLFWRAERRISENYSVFIHALDRHGRLLAQHDGWPADAHRPTSVLPTAATLRDVHYLTFSQDVPEDVILHVGLYDEQGNHLLTKDGSEYVTLALPN